MCSCIYLLWLNVDKLLYIQFPLHYYSMVSRKKFLLLTIATWMFLISFIGLMNYFFRVGNSCLEISFNDHPLHHHVLLLPGGDRCFILHSAIIYCIAQTTTRMEHRARTKLFQRLFFLFSSTLWTFITCVPFRVLFLVNMMFGVRSEWQRLLTDVSFKLLVTHLS
ncbi:unnamed protein product, partial [Mesorhabditis spiculigera]